LTHSFIDNPVGLQLVCHCDELRISFDKANIYSLRLVLISLSFPKKTRDGILEEFLSQPKRYGFFALSIKQRTFRRLDVPVLPPDGAPEAAGGSEEDYMAPLLSTADEFLDFVSDEPRKAKNLLQFILKRLPANAVDANDLSISLRTNRGQIRQISLFDYLYYCFHDQKPSKEIVGLHLWLQKKMTLPGCFVANSHLKSAR